MSLFKLLDYLIFININEFSLRNINWIFHFFRENSQISDLTSNPKNGLFWPKFFASNPQKKLLIKFLMVQIVYWIFCGQIEDKKFPPFQRSVPLVLNFWQKSKTRVFVFVGKILKIFFVWFQKKLHFWNRLCELISKM